MVAQKKKNLLLCIWHKDFFFGGRGGGPPPLLPLLLPGSKGIFKLISMHSLFPDVRVLHSLFPDVRVLLNRINHIVYDISYRRYYSCYWASSRALILVFL